VREWRETETGLKNGKRTLISLEGKKCYGNYSNEHLKAEDEGIQGGD